MADSRSGANALGGSTPRTRVRRLPELARYDRDTVHGILDATSVCHLGVVVDGEALVLPTLHRRDGDDLLIHGSRSNRAMAAALAAPRVCVTVTIIDGLRVARSAFNSSVAYRSAVVFGPATLVEDGAEHAIALDLLTDGVIPGRVGELRRPTASELSRTKVLRVHIEEASAKVSSGPPGDDDEDLEAGAWAGVLPIERRWGAPLPAPDGAVGRGEVPLDPSIQHLLEGPAW